jgi:hypothetical protein
MITFRTRFQRSCGGTTAILIATLIVWNIGITSQVWLNSQRLDRIEGRVADMEQRVVKSRFERQGSEAALTALINSLVKHSLVSASDARKAVADAKHAAGGRRIGPVLDNLFTRRRASAATSADSAPASDDSGE